MAELVRPSPDDIPWAGQNDKPIVEKPLTAEQAFRKSLKEAGEAIDKTLSTAEISDQEKAAVQGLLMSFVENSARDLGMAPKEFWDKHGLSAVLGPKAAEKAAGVKGASLHMATPKEFGLVYTGFERKPKQAVAYLLKQKTGACLGVFYHKLIGPIGLMYGKEGAGPEDKGGSGLAHMEKKHPGAWKLIQPTLDKGRILGGEEVLRYENRISISDGANLVILNVDVSSA